MRIDILTLFPEHMNEMLHESILGRAAKKGILELNCVQIRDYTENKQRQVDDYPYGGGWGCVMAAQPLKSCLDSVKAQTEGLRSRVIYMSPQGKTFNQQRARELVRDYDSLILVCGHYEGVDERFITSCVDEEISIGDFVLTGGELAAMAVADCVCRMVPGVLSDPACYMGESHWEGLLEYPQYTRPEEWEGQRVPDVLLNGNHAQIEHWRRRKMLERTMQKRPEMMEKFTPDKTDKAIIAEIEKDSKRRKLTAPVLWRAATEEDIPAISEIFMQSKAGMKSHGLDQWQAAYPNAESAREDIASGEGFVLTYEDRVCAYFAVVGGENPDYNNITDGKWPDDLPYCTVHRACVEMSFRGTPVADRVCSAADEIALSRGYTRLRGDTHKNNKPTKALMQRNGYKFCGNLILSEVVMYEENHDPRRQGYCKILD